MLSQKLKKKEDGEEEGQEWGKDRERRKGEHILKLLPMSYTEPDKNAT